MFPSHSNQPRTIKKHLTNKTQRRKKRLHDCFASTVGKGEKKARVKIERRETANKNKEIQGIILIHQHEISASSVIIQRSTDLKSGSFLLALLFKGDLQRRWLIQWPACEGRRAHWFHLMAIQLFQPLAMRVTLPPQLLHHDTVINIQRASLLAQPQCCFYATSRTFSWNFFFSRQDFSFPTDKNSRLYLFILSKALISGDEHPPVFLGCQVRTF